MLEGGIRRSGNRMRINAQLVDAVTGAHRWAERYDRQVDDLFVIQDQVVRAIAPVLVAHVNKAEVERTLLKPPSTWQAHDFYLRGSESLRTYLVSYDGTDLRAARTFLEQSLSLDPNYSRSYVDLSYTYFTVWLNRVDADFLKPECLDRAYQLARKAVELDPNLPQARAQLGMVLSFKRRHDDAIAEFERARAMNPNFDDWRFANFLIYAGDAARALEVSQALVRLDPFYLPLAAGFLGLANYMLKRHDTAIAGLSEAAGRSPRHRPVRQWLAAAYGQAGQLEAAREEAAAVLDIERSIRSKAWRSSSRPLGAQKTRSIYSTACARPAYPRIEGLRILRIGLLASTARRQSQLRVKSSPPEQPVTTEEVPP